MAIFSVRSHSEPPDLGREQVLAIFKAAGDAELRRHVPELQTDGCGHIGFLCCGQTMTHEDWWIHTNNWLKHSTNKR